MFVATSEIVKKANRVYRECGTRDPYRIAADLGIKILECPFKCQRGAYKMIDRNRFIFVKDNLPSVMKDIVLLHEIGHDVLHRKEAAEAGGFKEFEIFDMTNSRMEYEANIFASQVSLDDQEFIEYCERGYDVQQIACAMNSNINLVALKLDTLISLGYSLRPQEHRNDFLRYDMT